MRRPVRPTGSHARGRGPLIYGARPSSASLAYDGDARTAAPPPFPLLSHGLSFSSPHRSSRVDACTTHTYSHATPHTRTPSGWAGCAAVPAERRVARALAAHNSALSYARRLCVPLCILWFAARCMLSVVFIFEEDTTLTDACTVTRAQPYRRFCTTTVHAEPLSPPHSLRASARVSVGRAHTHTRCGAGSRLSVSTRLDTEKQDTELTLAALHGQAEAVRLLLNGGGLPPSLRRPLQTTRGDSERSAFMRGGH